MAMKLTDRWIRMIGFLLFAFALLFFCSAALAEEPAAEADIQVQYETQKPEIDKELEAIAKQKEHPCIYITTLNGQAVLSKEEYVPAMIDVFNCPEEYRLTAPGGIRVRGNSTAEQGDEKPYRIKFEKKQNMLGLHDGRAYKSWVLLRSYWHLVPDYMGFNLAKEIFEGKYYCSDCIYVNLYLNGKSLGIYVLCEQNQAAKGRIDVKEPKEGEEQENIGFVLEIDNYDNGDHPGFWVGTMPKVTDIAGETRSIKCRKYSIKSDIRSDAQKAFIRKYMQSVFTILYAAAAEDKPMMLDEEYNVVSAEGVYDTALEAINAVMDLDSLANMVILEELVQNYDVGEGSFYMAVDFSEESIYPKLTFLAPWDLSWGYTEDPTQNYYASTFQTIAEGFDRSNGWFVLAMKIDGFRGIVRQKWHSLMESGVLQETVDKVMNECENLASDLGEDVWKLENARKIGEYVLKRIKWLNSQWQ